MDCWNTDHAPPLLRVHKSPNSSVIIEVARFHGLRKHERLVISKVPIGRTVHHHSERKRIERLGRGRLRNAFWLMLQIAVL